MYISTLENDWILSPQPEHSRCIQERRMHVPTKMYKDDGAALFILVHQADNIMPSGLRAQEILWIPQQRNTYQTAKIHGANSGVCHTDEGFRDLMVCEGRNSPIEDSASCSAFQPMWPGRAQDTRCVLCGWSLSKGLILEACCRFSRILVTTGLLGRELLMFEKRKPQKRLSA